MDRRMVVSLVSVVTLAACLSVGSALLTGNDARADGGAKARVRESSDKKPEAPPLEPAGLPSPVVPVSSVPVPPPVSAPVVPPGYSSTPSYPPSPANVTEPRDGSLTVQEILQLRGLKKRIGGDNLKRVVDALAE
jgi:hypothetical protein